jgi:hypothetical protein
LGGFQPDTEREAALYRMIQQLQRELAQLRRDLHARAPAREPNGTRDSDPPAHAGSRDRDPTPSRDPAYNRMAKIYQAYDKNNDKQVSFEEFLAMREGTDDPRVRVQAQATFKQVDRNGDSYVSFEEFFAASQHRPRGDQPRREGDAPRDRDDARDGDRPRDGEGIRDRG